MSLSRRVVPVVTVLFLLGLSVFLQPKHSLFPSVQGTSRTISLVGYAASGWNMSNPTVPVNQGDIVTIKASSGDGAPHQFLLDVDRDGFDTSDCSPPAATGDPCTMVSAAPQSITFTASFTPGTYSYHCTVHPTTMNGNFVVQAPPTADFSIASSPPTLTISQGSSGTSMITLTSVNGFSGTVNLAATVSPVTPSGPIASFTPSASVMISAGTSGTSTLTVSTSSSTPSGAYSVKVNGTSGSMTHATTVTVQVNAPAGEDFSINASPSTLNVTQGSSSSLTLTLTSVNSFSGILSLTGTVSPTGPSVSLSPTSVTLLSATGSITSTLTVSAVAGTYGSVATGNYSLNVTATNGSLSHSKIVAATVSSTTSPPSGTGGLPVLALVVVAVVIIAAVGVVVYLVRRKPVPS